MNISLLSNCLLIYMYLKVGDNAILRSMLQLHKSICMCTNILIVHGSNDFSEFNIGNLNFVYSPNFNVYYFHFNIPVSSRQFCLLQKIDYVCTNAFVPDTCMQNPGLRGGGGHFEFTLDIIHVKELSKHTL